MEKYSLDDCSEIWIPEIVDERGNLAVIQQDMLPFEMKRLFFIYDVPRDQGRGGHAHREQKTLLVALNGSFEVTLDDGLQKKTITLQEPTQGLILQPGIWSVLENFTTGAICLAVNSGVYDEGDYIRSYDLFLSLATLSQ